LDPNRRGEWLSRGGREEKGERERKEGREEVDRGKSEAATTSVTRKRERGGKLRSGTSREVEIR